MSKTTNNCRGSNTLVNGLERLRFFAKGQVFVSFLMAGVSFMMMLFSEYDLAIGGAVLGLVLVIILHRLKISQYLLEAIDFFKKYSESEGKKSEKMYRLSYGFLIWMKNSRIFLGVLFCGSCLIVSALILVGASGIVVIALTGVLGFLLLILAAYHAGILTFLQGLRDTFEDSVFQLATVLIAVPFCTNLIPGLIGLLAWIIVQFIGQFNRGGHVGLFISPFSVWGSIAGFFGANLVAWWLVDMKAGFMIKDLEEGRGVLE